MEQNTIKYLTGEWKDFTFRMIEPEDYPVFTKLWVTFLKDEPAGKLIGYSDEYGREFTEIVLEHLKNKMGFFAIHTQTGEIAAFRVQSIKRRSDPPIDESKFKSRAGLFFARILNAAEKKGSLFDKFGVDFYCEYFGAYTLPKYRNQGLIKEMYRRSNDFLTAEGYPLASTIFTNPFSRAAVKANGFEAIVSIPFRDILDNEGKCFFDEELLKDEHFACKMVKIFNKVN